MQRATLDLQKHMHVGLGFTDQRPDFRFGGRPQRKKTELFFIFPFLPGNFFPHCRALMASDADREGTNTPMAMNG